MHSKKKFFFSGKAGRFGGSTKEVFTQKEQRIAMSLTGSLLGRELKLQSLFLPPGSFYDSDQVIYNLPSYTLTWKVRSIIPAYFKPDKTAARVK